MIDVIKQKLENLRDNNEKYNYLREFLQLLILKTIDELGFFRHIAFVGGTALRVLYGLERFSEGLDFTLIDKSGYDFTQMIELLVKQLNLYNLDVSFRAKDHKAVASAFIKFNTVLPALGLTPHHDTKLMIKFEVDQNPPAGYQTQLTIVNKEFLIGINAFDQASLFAGKLHALLCRHYTKGRDYYDFIWYVGKKIRPNYLFLENAILQTENKQLILTAASLKQMLIERIETTNFDHVKTDIKPFLVDQNELRFFEKPVFLSLVQQLSYNNRLKPGFFDLLRTKVGPLMKLLVHEA